MIWILDTLSEFVANINLDLNLTGFGIVFILQQKLDSESNGEWQKQVGPSTVIPAYNKFKGSLHLHFTVLEAISATMKRPTNAVLLTSVQASKENGLEKLLPIQAYSSLFNFYKPMLTNVSKWYDQHVYAYNCLSTEHMVTIDLSNLQWM